MSSRHRRWTFRLRHIIDAVRRIEGYVSGMTSTDFASDRRTVDAVIRNLEIIGGAARHVPDTGVSAHPEAPWSEMRAIRNVLAHDYDRVSLPIIWNTVKSDLPPLVPLLTSALEQAGDEG